MTAARARVHCSRCRELVDRPPVRGPGKPHNCPHGFVCVAEPKELKPSRSARVPCPLCALRAKAITRSSST